MLTMKDFWDGGHKQNLKISNSTFGICHKGLDVPHNPSRMGIPDWINIKITVVFQPTPHSLKFFLRSFCYDKVTQW